MVAGGLLGLSPSGRVNRVMPEGTRHPNWRTERKILMPMPAFARIAGAVALTAALAGCIDVEMDIDVLTDNTARGTMTATIDKQMYDMMMAQGGDTSADFCETGTITVGDTTVTCVDVREGAFDELDFDEEAEGAEPTIVNEGGGRVRVTIPLNEVPASMGEEAQDPQAMAMISAMFQDKNMVIRISGGRIIDSNLEIAPDGQSASLTIPFTDLFSGSATFPAEAYAVVQK